MGATYLIHNGLAWKPLGFPGLFSRNARLKELCAFYGSKKGLFLWIFKPKTIYNSSYPAHFEPKSLPTVRPSPGLSFKVLAPNLDF